MDENTQKIIDKMLKILEDHTEFIGVLQHAALKNQDQIEKLTRDI